MDSHGKKYARETEFAVYKYDQRFFSGEGYKFQEWDKPVERRVKPGDEARVLEKA
jgi:hypothetical protein